LPVASITSLGPTTLCAGGSVTLDAGAGFVSYLWSNGAIMQTISLNTTGSFTVRVTDSNGYQSLPSVPVSVTINPLPVASITPGGPAIFCAGGNVTLDAGS